MITLQRASAGSGKTFALTKEYIGLLISIEKYPGAPADKRRLRTKAELADSVEHILAVTFTNKATNEMKDRIITKLDELAHYSASDSKMPDYLADYMKDYDATSDEISDACREVLEQILYNYSDFNISTIDSFFQNILRTFAYESDLPDSYQVIIDDTHLSSYASNALVDDIAHGEADEDEKYWVKSLMRKSLDKGSNNWNIFLRSTDGRNARGVFRQLSQMAASLDRMENEEIRNALDRFQQSGRNLRVEHNRIINFLEERAAELFGPLVSAAACVLDAYKAEGDAPLLLPYGKKTFETLVRISSSDADPMGEYKLDGRIKSHISGSKLSAARKRELEYLKPVWEDFMNAYTGWRSFIDGEDMKYWRLIEPSLPAVALTATLRERIQNYLTENSAMKIADTNSMIRRIIGDDDVPFIYERLGSRLNHFLIDEFQDTSQMQWDNFRPLLEESESHGFSNLIIGDAKQSIYRFRNAEPRLITEKVPATFGDHIIPKGDSEADNSNWRSRTKIVKFNNFFFRSLATILAETHGERIKDLYRNTVQLPRSKDYPVEQPQEGYVEINFYDPQAEALIGMSEDEPGETEESGKTSKVPSGVIRKIGEQISNLLDRGYKQKEIAVLVNTREGGKQVISGLMEYNRNLAGKGEVLEFVSEDSLTLESSGAVNIVMECFRLLQENLENREAAGNDNPMETNESGSYRRSYDWAALRTNFLFFSARHPGLSLPERIERFFNESLRDTEIDDLVGNMQAVTLPSLVEAFAEFALVPERRQLEAPFLAALQDAVLDYCEANPTDIGSMLRWWDSRGKNISISSPEGTNAINVMTIHKSKGLEFECVFLPDLDLRLDMNRETLWVKVPGSLSYAERLPEMLPVELSQKSAEGTEWEADVEEERYQVTVDNLNKVYVAMTRAVSELYVFLPDPFKKECCSSLEIETRAQKYVRGKAFEICKDAETLLAENRRESDGRVLPEVDGIRGSDDSRTFTYGSPVENVQEALEKSREKEKNDGSSEIIETYYINSNREILQFKPEWQPHLPEEADDDRVDPLSEGSEKHSVLEYVVTEEDLPKALERLRSRGMLTRKKVREYLPELQEALESVRDRGWFDGSMKVFNERPMLSKGQMLRRPDRVMVTAEGDAIVVDYKFSTPENFTEKVKAHRRQVGEYMGWLEAMRQFHSVKGYIWYVNKGDIIEVEKSISVEAQKKDQRQAYKKSKDLDTKGMS